jgi:hypothetical protein
MSRRRGIDRRRIMRFVRVVLLITFLTLCRDAGTASAHPPRAVRPFSKTDATERLPPGPPGKDFPDSQCLRRSPDGRFEARLTICGGEIGYLTVYRAAVGRGPFERRYAVSGEFGDVHTCAWVPGHGHWLVVTTGGADSGVGMLALWTSAGQTRMMRRAASPRGEGFDLRGITPDGRAVLYEHYGENSPDPEGNGNTRLRLELPRS